jgi:uncharacterized membrane protein
VNDFIPNHPVFVHFPIALLASAFFFELLGLLLRRQSLHDVGRALLFLGTFSALVAVGTGLWAEKLTDPGPRGLEAVSEPHKTWAFVTTGLAVVLCMWRIASRKKYAGSQRGLFVLGLAALTGVIFYTGHLGGQMVYDHGAGVTVGKRTLASKPLPAESYPGVKHEEEDEHGDRDKGREERK